MPPIFLKNERRWALGFALVVMLATSIPYLWGFASQGEEWRFSGFVFGVEDGNSYIAKMLSGAAGAWLFRTPYTAYPQRGVLAFFPYILLGKLTVPPRQHEQLVVLFHLYRFAAGILAILATYDFLSLFINELRWRRYGLVLVTLGGGLGWILVILMRTSWQGSLPLEFYSPESFGFLSLYGLPHLAAGRALQLWGLRSYLLESARVGRVKSIGRLFDLSNLSLLSLKPGLIWLLLGLMQPLTIVVSWAVVAAHLVGLAAWQGCRARSGVKPDWGIWTAYACQGLLGVAVSSPLVVYTIRSFNNDPFLRTWAAQNLTLSPHPAHYLLAYGLLIPFVVIGGYRIFNRGYGEPHCESVGQVSISDPSWWSLLPVTWILLLPLLAYAPYNLQRRLPEGIWVALVVVSVKSIDRIRSGEQALSCLNSFTVATGFLFPSTFMLLAGGLLAAGNPGPPIFRPVGEVDAFQNLSSSAEPGEVVLSAYETGNALPAWAPVRVVIGHGPESVGLEYERFRVKAFFQAQTLDADRRALLVGTGVHYVFWGPAERTLGNWNPAEAEYLRLVYEAGKYMVFRFIR